CFAYDLFLLTNENFLCITYCSTHKNTSRVHVHNVQVCYICILVPCCCAAPINLSAPINSSFTSG
uniref:Uncharacterized protein n=1 Tax=Macaca fascicularis TaxID=9541 RepID=A0A7N9D4G1_MACFA